MLISQNFFQVSILLFRGLGLRIRVILSVYMVRDWVKVAVRVSVVLCLKLGFHRYGCGMLMRLADASNVMRFV